jgi:transcriptional regulator
MMRTCQGPRNPARAKATKDKGKAMHPNPVFHTQEAAHNLAYARERAFGVLAVNGPDGPLLSHVPFLLDEDGKTLWLHLMRSNPIARALKASIAARIAVSGPDSYVSPDWYGVADQVPTWNYVAVHLTGTLELRPQEELHAVLDRQSALFEERLLPKAPWTTDKMSEGVMERMMRAIVPCCMTVEAVDGTWKVNQNKPDDVRRHAADHVDAYGQGVDVKTLSALMRGVDGRK